MAADNRTVCDGGLWRTRDRKGVGEGPEEQPTITVPRRPLDKAGKNLIGSDGSHNFEGSTENCFHPIPPPPHGGSSKLIG